MDKNIERYKKKLKIAEQKVQILEDMIEDRTRDLHLKVEENEALELFAYVSSHDMKEPLRSIKSFAEILQEDYVDVLDEKGLKYLGLIKSGAEQLSRMILGLLEHSKLGRSKSRKLVNCNKVVEDVKTQLSMLVKETKAKVSCAPLPIVNAFEIECKLLFQNLINNAIKFRKPGVKPIVKISASVNGEEYVFAVKDNGIGIDTIYHKEIFDVFHRLHPEDVYEGTGLGLANCKKIVELHEGRIWVKSEQGKGSTFFFTFKK